MKIQNSSVNIVQVYFPREGYRLIANDLDKIREIENLKEKELKEAQRQANQLILENEKLIEQNRAQALIDAEKKAEGIKNNLLNEAREEVEKILKTHQEEADVLQKDISQRIPQVVSYLLEKVWQEYGN